MIKFNDIIVNKSCNIGMANGETWRVVSLMLFSYYFYNEHNILHHIDLNI